MDGEDFKSFLTFRKMIAPILIQILFWVWLTLNLIGSIYWMTVGGWFVLFGFLLLIFGSLAVRLWCEVLIVLFRMYESLREISSNMGTTVKQYQQPATVQSAADKTCPSCGNKVDPGLNFCNNCGAALR